MEFDQYLISKNIAPVAFITSESNLYALWESAFNHMHENSFTEQYKFQLNKIRRKYPYKTEF
jgi:hypothetical protein